MGFINQLITMGHQLIPTATEGNQPATVTGQASVASLPDVVSPSPGCCFQMFLMFNNNKTIGKLLFQAKQICN